MLDETQDYFICQRIKEQRKSNGLSLRQLAQKTGLTASFLSKVERGQANPSIGTLRRIADSLEISILNLFVEPLEASPVITEETRPKVTLPEYGIRYELITSKSLRKIEAFIGRISPSVGNFVRPLREPTEECVFVLSGAISVELETGCYTLHAGDRVLTPKSWTPEYCGVDLLRS